MKYKDSNVIYILTTSNLEKERRYILGKTQDLTKRIGNYNKYDKHKVIYYKSCGSDYNMNMIENILLNRFEKYKERKNRERIIVPKNYTIDYFINIIENLINIINVDENV